MGAKKLFSYFRNIEATCSSNHTDQSYPNWRKREHYFKRKFFGFFLFMYVIQHCFICRHSDSTVSEDAGTEPRTVATLALTDRRSDHSAKTCWWCYHHLWNRYGYVVYHPQNSFKKGAIRRIFVLNKYIPALNMNFVKDLCRSLWSKDLSEQDLAKFAIISCTTLQIFLWSSTEAPPSSKCYNFNIRILYYCGSASTVGTCDRSSSSVHREKSSDKRTRRSAFQILQHCPFN